MAAQEDLRISPPYVFGVGWTINVGRFVQLIRHVGDPLNDCPIEEAGWPDPY
jgi:hypothetical protein